MNKKLLVASMLFGLTVASNSYAACVGYACDGQDPVIQGCASDAIRVASNTIYIKKYNTNQKVGYVEMMWSARCGTNWAKTTRTDGYSGENMMAEINRTSPNTRKFKWTPGYTSLSSPMVYGKNLCTYAGGLVDQSAYVGSAYTITICK
jgi:hypothetical protein